jgi:hypothetical protein
LLVTIVWVVGSTGGDVREVCRADDPLRCRQRRDDVQSFIDVIAERDDIDAIAPQLVEQIRRDSASAGDVLGVGDHQVHLVLTHQRRQFLVHDLPARPTNDVSQRQNPKRHGGRLTVRLRICDELRISGTRIV